MLIVVSIPAIGAMIILTDGQMTYRAIAFGAAMTMTVLPPVPTAAAQAPAAPASGRCATGYRAAEDLAGRFDRAARDIRACIRSGTVAPAVGRRGLAAIAGLRDLADYDERRAWGTRTGPRQRLYERRLDAVMAAALR